MLWIPSKKLPFFIFFIVQIMAACSSHANKDTVVYLFSHFKENGEDGLHFAYSYDGYQWEVLGDGQSFLVPEVGDDKLMRDPCIIRGKDGNFHMVWTVSWDEKGIGYASSPDLIHWSEQKYLPVMEHEPNARNTWAPEIFYDGKEEMYLIFWSSTITGLYPETQAEEEKGYNHRMYAVTTKDFEQFSQTQLFFEPGYNVIDGSIVKSGEDYLLFHKDETVNPPKKNIRISRSNKITDGYSVPGKPITGDYWAEGPTITKIDDLWVVYFDKYMEKNMGAVSSSDLVYWTDISDQVRFPSGTRHGTVFQVNEEEFIKLKNSVGSSN